jgi:hypothetical protein
VFFAFLVHVAYPIRIPIPHSFIYLRLADDFSLFVSLSSCNFLREQYQYFPLIFASTWLLSVQLALQIEAFTISINPTVTSGFPAIATWFRDNGDPSSFGLMQRSLMDSQVKVVTGVLNGEGASSGTVQITFNQVG